MQIKIIFAKKKGGEWPPFFGNELLQLVSNLNPVSKYSVGSCDLNEIYSVLQVVDIDLMTFIIDNDVINKPS